MTSQTSLPGFEDDKSPDAFRTIGEVAKAMGIRQHVLRYWEEQFPMLKPVKRSGGRRYYRPEDIQLIAAIDRLVHREGYTLRGARKAIESGARPVTESSQSETAATPDILPQLRTIRKTLAAALAEA